jgi:pyruvate,water dikinase
VSAYAVAFEDEVARDVAHAGGKAARLAEMTQAGVPVPAGFVVCADAWREFVAAADHRERIAAALAGVSEHSPAAALDAAAAELHRIVLGGVLPERLAAEVRDAYAGLAQDAGIADPPVAVRSSATVEDAAGDSYAGQYESYLWIRGAEDVLRHVQRCWAGLFSAHGLAYAARRDADVVSGGMAVVVQRMVHARASGVMFTLDPATGDPSVVSIEGSWGLGSTVVGGEVTPDQYVVAKATMSIRDRRVRRKDVLDAPVADGGTRREDVPEDRREAPCLRDEEILELARIARTLERRYGAPQDVEWSIDGELGCPDGVFVVQCRPETVWSRRRATPVLDPGAGALSWITQALTKGA